MISTILSNLSIVLSAYTINQIEKNKKENNVDLSEERINDLLGEYNKMMDDYEEKKGKKPETYEELKDAALNKIWKDSKEIFSDESNIVFRVSYSDEYNMRDVVFFVDKKNEKLPDPVVLKEIANEFILIIGLLFSVYFIILLTIYSVLIKSINRLSTMNSYTKNNYDLTNYIGTVV